jgi:hypothetical protein
MAKIRKRGRRWQVQVRRSNGYRASRSFLLRADAERWAREAEAEADRRFLQTDPTQLAKLRLSDLLRRYGSCPLAWCSWCWSPMLRGQGWPGHTVTADNATTGLSPIGAMVSRLM